MTPSITSRATAPLSGDYKGKDAIFGFFTKIMQETDGTFRLEVHDILASDDHGVVLVRQTAQRNGKSWDSRAIHVTHSPCAINQPCPRSSCDVYDEAKTMRSRPVAVIAVSLLLIAGATGFQVRGQVLHLLGADRPDPGAPQAIGNTWACPPGWLKAYQSGMVYYPSYHPTPPSPGMKPTRCYETASAAKSAGFKLAPPPTGGAVLDGVYLVPAEVETVCQAAATQLSIVIPCPTLLPVDGSGEGFLCPPGSIPDAASCSPNSGTPADGFFMSFTLTTPPDYPGTRAWLGLAHVRMEITALLSPSQTAQQNNNSCTRGNAGPTVMERPTLWTTCDSPSTRIVKLTWEIDNAIYAIGSLDETAAGRRMVQFLASKLVPVSPISG
jgi:hypothetical protein